MAKVTYDPTNGSSRDLTNTELGKNVNAPSQSRVMLFTSNPIAVSSVVVAGIDVSRVVLLIPSNGQKNNQAITEIRRITAPGALSPGSTNYTNRPRIQVVLGDISASSKSGEKPVGEYSDFYLSSISEQDAERTEIIETFGEPHFFTSGRFTRKFTFSGTVRTTGINPSAGTAQLRVPQHVLLRNFYERYLRSTAQAQFGYFTRIIVDGDIFEGYVIALQMPRDAAMEMVMPFSLSMIVIRRYNVNDNDAQSVLSKFVGAPIKQLPTAFAKASLQDASDAFKLQLSLGGVTSDTGLTYNTGKVNQDGTIQGVQQELNLISTNGGLVITVDGDGSGIWELRYADDDTVVSGTPSRGGTVPLKLALLSYPKLTALAASGNASVSLTLHANGAVGPTLQVVSVADESPQLQVKSVSITMQPDLGKFNAVMDSKVTGSDTITNARTYAVQSGPVWNLTFDITYELATLDGVTLTADQLSQPPADVINLTTTQPHLSLAGSAQASPTLPQDVAIISDGFDFSGATYVSLAPGTITYQGVRLPLRTSADLTTVNPFILANLISFGFSADFNVNGYAALPGTSIRIGLDMGKQAAVTQLFSSLTTVSSHNAWAITDEGGLGNGHVYSAVLLLKASPYATGLGLDLDKFTSLLDSASFAIQYNEGTVVADATPNNQTYAGAGLLNVGSAISPKPKQLQLTQPRIIFNTDTLAITLYIYDGSGSDTPDTIAALQNVLSHPTKITLNFPAGYNTPPIVATL